MLIKSYKSFIDTDFPELILTLNDSSVPIAALNASTTSNTNTKSRVCFPSPNIVTGSLPIYDPGPPANFIGGNYLLGGKHFIYVLGAESGARRATLSRQ